MQATGVEPAHARVLPQLVFAASGARGPIARAVLLPSNGPAGAPHAGLAVSRHAAHPQGARGVIAGMPSQGACACALEVLLLMLVLLVLALVQPICQLHGAMMGALGACGASRARMLVARHALCVPGGPRVAVVGLLLRGVASAVGDVAAWGLEAHAPGGPHVRLPATRAACISAGLDLLMGWWDCSAMGDEAADEGYQMQSAPML